MNDRDECRNPACSNDPRGGGGFSGRFCSTPCELRYEHVRADARDAQRETREEDGL